MTLDLNSWETRLVLEALVTLDQKWTAIIEAAAVAERRAADFAARQSQHAQTQLV